MAEDEVRAKAVREAATYLARIYQRGLQSRDCILNDLEAVAYRMENGMTARGFTRVTKQTEPEERGKR